MLLSSGPIIWAILWEDNFRNYWCYPLDLSSELSSGNPLDLSSGLSSEKIIFEIIGAILRTYHLGYSLRKEYLKLLVLSSGPIIWAILWEDNFWNYWCFPLELSSGLSSERIIFEINGAILWTYHLGYPLRIEYLKLLVLSSRPIIWAILWE